MTKKILTIVLVLLFCATLGAFAVEKKSSVYPWMAWYNTAGNLNIYGAVGLYGIWGIDGSVGAEIIIADFDLAGIPLAFGVQARGLIGLPLFLGVSWIEWGAAPMASLHWGVDLGNSAKFDIYVAVGLGLYGFTGGFGVAGYNDINFGFGTYEGIAWQLSDNFALILDGGYIGYTYTWGVGVMLKL